MEKKELTEVEKYYLVIDNGNIICVDKGDICENEIYYTEKELIERGIMYNDRV